jgi:hypothetical protein
VKFFGAATAPSDPGPPHRGFTITLRHTISVVISPTQRPLPDNTQLSQHRDMHAADEIRIRNTNKRPAANAPVTRKLNDRIFHFPPLSPGLWWPVLALSYSDSKYGGSAKKVDQQSLQLLKCLVCTTKELNFIITSSTLRAVHQI